MTLMRTCTIVLFAIAVSAANPLSAQDRPPELPPDLSLEEAVDLAIHYNPSYRQAANDASPAGWAVRNAYTTLLLPRFDASTSFNYSGSGSQRFLTTDFQQPSATVGSSYGLSLSWAFDGSTLFRPSVEKAAQRATLASIDAVGMTIRNLVAQQYLGVLEALAQVALQEQEVTRNEENLRLAQARFDVGQSTILDVRQAEVAKGRSDVALLQANQAVIVEKLRLFQQMGVPAPIELETVALTDTFPVMEPDWVLDDLLRMAEEQNPDVLSLRAQARSAGRNESAVKSEWLPSMRVSAGWSGFTQQFTDDGFLISQAQTSATGQMQSCANQNQINTVAGLPVQDCSAFAFTPQTEADIRASNSAFPFSFQQQPFQAGVTFSLPIFDQFSRSLQVSQASAQTEDAEEAVRARELLVRTEVTQMHYGLLAAYEAIQLQLTNRVAAQEQLRLQRERYRVGSGTFFELLDAQLLAEQAEADYITALYSYHRAMANLEAAVGRRLR